MPKGVYQHNKNQLFKKGHVVTLEMRRKIGLGNSIALIGRTLPKEVIDKIINSKKGFKHTEETKKLISLKQIGFHNSPLTQFKSGSSHPNFKNGLSTTKEMQKEYYRNNKCRYKSYAHKRRTKIKDLRPQTIKLVYDDNIKKYGTLTCYICLKQIDKWALEHKIPISRGGTNDYENLGISCKSCNSKKHTRTITEMQELLSKLEAL